MSVQFLGGTRTGAGGQPLPFSPAVKAGPFVFVSGQVAMGDNGEIVPGGIEAQTRQTLKNVEKALALAGCTLKDVVKSTVWLDDARDFWTFNRVYAEFFSENKPARSTTQATLMLDAKVEIEVIAYKACGRGASVAWPESSSRFREFGQAAKPCSKSGVSALNNPLPLLSDYDRFGPRRRLSLRAAPLWARCPQVVARGDKR